MSSPARTGVGTLVSNNDELNTIQGAEANISSADSDDTDLEAEEDNVTLETNPHKGQAVNEDVVGFSIGIAQSYLRSPKTPAAEKVRVLDGSLSYSAAAVTNNDGNETDGGSSTSTEDVGMQSNVHIDHGEAVSPWRAGEAHKRSSATKVLLSHSLSLSRRRASSGPSSLAGSFKKLLPDMTSFFPRATPADAGPDRGLHPREPEQIGKPQEATVEPQSGTRRVQPLEERRKSISSSKATTDDTASEFVDASRHPSAFRHANEALLSPTDTAMSGKLTRSTSESSLYLRPLKTSSSAAYYDDTSLFADVSTQVNSRLKAIQDTWQDSSFAKMPKLPSISMIKGLPFDWMNHDSHPQASTATSKETPQISKTKDRLKISNGSDAASNERAHPIMHRALSKMTGDVVVMGGYRGSILRSAEPPNRQLWVPVKVGLNIRKVDLEVGLKDEDEESMHTKIFASGMLTHIGPVDISRRLLRHLKKAPNTKAGQLRVHDYGYDWRLSPELLSRHLIEFLESLDCNKQDAPKQSRGAWVIAHSLGGLITRHAANLRPELFAGVVFAGTPQTCVNVLGPLRNGDDVLLSSKVLTAQTNFSFRTSFALLPEDGRCFIDKMTGERYDVDFFNPQTYDEYRLTPCMNPPISAVPKQPRKSIVGAMSSALSDTISSALPNREGSWFGSGRPSSPAQSASAAALDAKDTVKDTAKNVAHVGENSGSLEPSNMASNQPSKSLFSTSNNYSIATACTIPKDVAVEYLTRTLASILRFKQSLYFRPEHQAANLYPPLAIIFGKTVPTVYGARVESREAIKRSDAYDDLAFAAGDGVVLASAAQLPTGYRCVRGGRIQTDRGHVGLLGDIEAVGRALEAVSEARSKGVGLGKGHVRPKNGL
jgi:pimeloyl-ACP methyl ester carboxylesterase